MAEGAIIVVDVNEKFAAFGERQAKTEGSVSQLNDTVNRLIGHIERSGNERTLNHTAVVTKLTEINTRQEFMQKAQDTMQKSVDLYQVECTADRKENDKRVGIIEKKQSGDAGWNKGIAACISLFVSGVGYFIGKK